MSRWIAGALATAGALGAQAESPKVTISFSIEGDQTVIEVQGEDVQVTVNGDEIDGERLRKTGNWHQVLDDSKNVIAQFFAADRNAQVSFPKLSQKAYLGVDLQEVAPVLAEHLDLDPDEVSQVTSVNPNSPAAKVGLRTHDVLLRIDGEAPGTRESLREILERKKPGDTLRLSILRRGEQETVRVKLGRASGNLQFWGNSFPTMFNSGVLENSATGKTNPFYFPGSLNTEKWSGFDSAKDLWQLQQAKNFFGDADAGKLLEMAKQPNPFGRLYDVTRGYQNSKSDDEVAAEIEQLEKKIKELEKKLRDRRN